MQLLTISKKRKRIQSLTGQKNVDLKQFTIEKKKPIAGWGACKSCSCSGFIDKGGGSMSCGECDHHWSRHR